MMRPSGSIRRWNWKRSSASRRLGGNAPANVVNSRHDSFRGISDCRRFGFRCAGIRRPRLPAMAGGAMAGRASARRLARHLRRRDARARARPVAARSRHSGRAGKAAAAAGIRADAVAISARGDVRAARRARQATRRAIPRHAGAHRARDRRARQCRAGDLGARDRLRRLQAAARRHPRAGDAGLYRQAQGLLPQRIPARA